MHILRMTGDQRRSIMDHLFDGSGLEAVSVALLGRAAHDGRTALTVHRVRHVPHSVCDRRGDGIVWPTSLLKSLLAEAAAGGMGVMRIHSHPGGFDRFSEVDDASDAELFDAIDLRAPGLHASVVMLPDGSMFGRRLEAGQVLGPLDRIAVVDDDLAFHDRAAARAARDFDLRHRQLFGDGTTDLLARLSVGVVGASGTGSPVIEMLARLGVGRIVIVDPDFAEHKNLNRIWGSTRADADARTPKATMMRDHLERIGLGTVVEAHVARVEEPTAMAALATCDLLFGCVDSVEGRDVLNRIATFHTLPFSDLGVRLDADGAGGVSSVSAGVRWLTPGRSSLRTRGVYDERDLYAERLHRTDPERYADQLARGYVKGVAVDRPAVISINTATAAAAVNEMLARLHPFRSVDSAGYATTKLLFTHGRTKGMPEGPGDEELARHIGRGDADPPLLSALAEVAR